MKRVCAFLMILALLTGALGSGVLAAEGDSSHVHTLEYVEEQPATCLEAGTGAHYVCTGCGRTFEDETAARELTPADLLLPATGHRWGVPSVQDPAEATKAGKQVYRCRNCGERKVEEMPVLVDMADVKYKTTPNEDGSVEIRFYTDSYPDAALPLLPEPVVVELETDADRADVVIKEDVHKLVIYKSTVEDGKARFLCDRSCSVRLIYNSKRFVDVPRNGNWMERAVRFASSHELFVGVTNYEFAPDMNMTRAMLVTVLWRLEDRPDPETGASFLDVPAGAWYEKAVAWGVRAGIVYGYDNATFGPNDSLTREQMAAFLMRYAAYAGLNTEQRGDLSLYTDGDRVSDWAIRNGTMAWAVGAGIIQGTNAASEAPTLSPRDSATRAQVAAMLQRLVRLLVPEA